MSVMDQVNSGSTKAQAIFDDAILYPNPYMVVTQKGYTKHYYADTERLATVIGGGGLNELTQAIVPAYDPHDDEIKKAFDKPYLNYDPFRHQGTVGSLVPTEDIERKTSPELEYQCKPAELLMVEVLGDKDMLLALIKEYGEVREEETKRYFYHGDHLGSANWITDYTGAPIQYIHYAPYGELIDNQVPYGYDERYKFTGKERDWETGYDYYGARYLWSDAGIFISPDPLSDKTPEISSYAYCGWNPIKYIDPDGNSAKDKIMGWTLGSITNAIPLASLTNIRDSYTPDNPSDYNNSLQCVDNLAFCAGAALMASGAADVVGGTAIAEAGLAVATTGVGAPEGAGVAAIGGTLIGTGLLKGAIGGSLMANSSNNKGGGYSRGNSGTKGKSINQLQQDVSRGESAGWN